MDVPVSALERARIGERWVLRMRLADGSATDVIGWIEDLGPDQITLATTPGSTATVPPAAVIVARRAPAAAGGPDPVRTSAEVLEQHALWGWLAHHESLGGWTLRAGAGFTGRANSCLAVGDPGRPITQAAAAIEAWSAAHGIDPQAQVIVGSGPDMALAALGWHETYVARDVMVARLARFLGTELPAPHVRVTEDFEPSWLTAYHGSRPNDADPEILRMILAGNPPRAFASVGPPEYLGIARGHVSGPWLGLGSIWVDVEQRRQGLATAMMRALGHWGARHGARYCYLQVAAENTTAISAYGRLGFRHHHTYRYVTPVVASLVSPAAFDTLLTETLQ